MVTLAAFAVPAQGIARSLTIDDVLDLTRIDRATLSPDGEWVAAVVQRAARPGEVYGRGYYELNPSRGDIWLISRRSGERRNLTQGMETGAGFWCATWSPDGSRLAMLSTRPEGNEPRGGDNVRLYVWDRATNTSARASDAAMMTQTTGGSPMYRVDLRGGVDGSTIAHRCSGEENAPFAWLDNRRLLAVTLPPGSVSGLIDASSRPARNANDTLNALRAGLEPTVTAVGSGAERGPRDERAGIALIQAIDVGTGVAATIASLPTYPFRGELTLNIAPGGRRIAVLATIGAIPPTREYRNPYPGDTWSVEKRVGFIEIVQGASIRWAAANPGARYPLDMFGWSPDGRRVALRARNTPDETATPLFVVSADNLSVVQVGSEGMSVGSSAAGASYPSNVPAIWIDNRRLLARVLGRAGPGPGSGSRADWWLVTLGGGAFNVTAGASEPPREFRRTNDGRLFAIAGGQLMSLEVAERTLRPVPSAPMPGQGSIAWPRDPNRETSQILVESPASGGERRFERFSLQDGARSSAPFALPQSAELLGIDLARGILLWREPTVQGLNLRETLLTSGESRTLLSLNSHLAEVNWGRTMLIDYRGEGGQALKAAVILPADYQPGRRYPTITWVYPGYHVYDLQDYFLDPYLPGIYNLQLYASRGFVVLIPSMPLPASGERSDILQHLTDGVLPAVDRLIEVGIADPDRLGLMGQSFGGYGVYGLVTQTNRFKAAVALAGQTDLASAYTQFDPTARGYPGIEHEKSYNWRLFEAGPIPMGIPPYEDRERYLRNSPLAFVDRVDTPLLLIHGEQDIRAPLSQAESFFYSLYRQGKTARLLRYWGENHGLSQSPANVRHIFEETVRWFNTYLQPTGRAESTQVTSGH